MDVVRKINYGRYEIIEKIGENRAARIYKGRCNLLNRYVTIKILNEDLPPRDRELVCAEAQKAAWIDNRYVESIYDVGEDDGLIYIITEYVSGITLKEYMTLSHCMEWRQAVSFALEICGGLSAAHKLAVVHNNIEPQNIIVTNTEDLKIINIGLSRAILPPLGMNLNLISTDMAYYLSPEQAKNGYIDERADIYSLGAVLYDMLTGQPPFNDDSIVTIMLKHIEEKPASLKSLNNNIPEALESIVMKALAKEPKFRYSNVEELAKDLNKVILNPNVTIDIQQDKEKINNIRNNEVKPRVLKYESYLFAWSNTDMNKERNKWK